MSDTKLPYIGPRPFERGDVLFGRDEEIRQLLYLLIAERLVVLHSPSGAGKTSLVQAGLIPQLEAEDFSVWPVIRVNQNQHPPAANRYLFSTFYSLEQELPESRRRSAEELAALSLQDYIASRPRRRHAPASRVLIFDQFEEILTADPLAVDAKQEFFRQLGEALQDPGLWALFAIREDYLAALSPYLNYLPTQLGNRFRLALLDLPKARAAIAEPARQAGKPFQDEALEALLQDLATVSVQQADGSFRQAVGHHIEPVQLQVVCLRLWRQLPAQAHTIGLAQLRESGNVNEALAAYYQEVCTEVSADLAASAEEKQRQIREWFDFRLITNGIRTQVPREKERSGGLENGIIEAFVNAHLLRAEKRAGATWYELAHDRLIEPVSQDNQVWFHAHLHPMQRHAAAWDRQGRPDSLLLQGRTLSEAERWARTRHDSLRDAEADLLEQSLRLRRRHRLKQAGLLLTLLSAIAIAVGTNIVLQKVRNAELRAVEEKQRALQAKDQALRTQSLFLTEQSRQQRDAGDTVTAALLALQALPEDLDAPRRPYVPEARQALYDAFVRQREIHYFSAHPAAVTQVAFSADGKRLFSFNANGEALWQDSRSGDILQRLPGLTAARLAPYGQGSALAVAEQGIRLYWKNQEFTLRGHRGTVQELAFHPRHPYLASADSLGQVCVWRTDKGALLTCLPHQQRVTHLRFDPQARQLLTLSADHKARLWALPHGELQLQLDGHQGTPLIADFSPYDSLLATAGEDRRVLLWDSLSGQLRANFYAHNGAVLDVHFSPDGTRLLSAGADGNLCLWNVTETRLQDCLDEHKKAVRGARFSPDGEFIASASADASVLLWDAHSLQRLARLRGHTAAVNALQFSPDGSYLASAADDHSLRLWRLFAVPDQLKLFHHSPSLRHAALSPDGALLATAGGEQVQLWDADSGQRGVALEHPVAVVQVLFSPDSQQVLTLAVDAQLRLWRADTGLLLHTFTGHRGHLSSAAFSPDGRFILSASDAAELFLWDAAAADLLQCLDSSGETPLQLNFSPDGRYLAASSQSSETLIWDMREIDAVRGAQLRYRLPSEASSQAVFSPDSRYLLSNAWSDAAQLWDLELGALRFTLEDHDGSVNQVAFGGQGRHLATAAHDHRVRLWNAEDGSLLQRLEGHREQILHLQFSADERRLLSASADGEVRLWRVADGSLLQRLPAREHDLQQAQLGPQARQVLTVTRQGAALWPLYESAQSLHTAARAALPRRLSATQKQAAFLDLEWLERFVLYRDEAYAHERGQRQRAALGAWQNALDLTEIYCAAESCAKERMAVRLGLARNAHALNQDALAEQHSRAALRWLAQDSEATQAQWLEVQDLLTDTLLAQYRFSAAAAVLRQSLERLNCAQSVQEECVTRRLRLAQTQQRAAQPDFTAHYRYIIAALDGEPREIEPKPLLWRVLARLGLLQTATEADSEALWEALEEDFAGLAAWPADSLLQQALSAALQRAEGARLLKLAEWLGDTRARSAPALAQQAYQQALNAATAEQRPRLLHKLQQVQNETTALLSARQLLDEVAGVDCAAKPAFCHYLSVAHWRLANAPGSSAKQQQKHLRQALALTESLDFEQVDEAQAFAVERAQLAYRLAALHWAAKRHKAAREGYRLAIAYIGQALQENLHRLDLREQLGLSWEALGTSLLHDPEATWQNLGAYLYDDIQQTPNLLLNLQKPQKNLLSLVDSFSRFFQTDEEDESTDLGEHLQQGLNALQQAEQHYQQAARVQPNEWRLYIHLARLYLLMGESGLQRAEQIERELYAPLPRDDKPPFWQALGDSLADHGLAEEALPAYDKQAEIMRATGDWNAVAEAYRAQIMLFPQLALAWFKLGEVLEASGDWEGALTAYRRLAQLQPLHPEAWDRQCAAQLKQGRFAAAETACRRQLAIKPEHRWAWYHLAQGLEQQGKIEAAIEALNRQVKIAPNHEDAWFLLGYLQSLQGRTDEAREAYRRQLEVKPDHESAHFYLRQLRKEQRMSAMQQRR